MNEISTYVNGRVFDGAGWVDGGHVTVRNHLVMSDEGHAPGRIIDLAGDILAPGFVDLQVNGGGGVNFNDAPDVETLRKMAYAHHALGATSILPTLITDTPEVTRAAIAAAKTAIAENVPGIAGLHLEGPHLSVVKCGAHDPGLIRPMTEHDLSVLAEAAATLPCLMVTLAPENATPEQVRALAEAGAIVMLGHTDCDAATAAMYFEAGARGATHLFNAMRQMGSRDPGLVGAALAHRASCGLIADGVHVDPVAMQVALAANPEIFLVSDAMAVAGTDLQEFSLNGRKVFRQNNELRLEDDTLAGADLDLTRALSVLVTLCGQDLSEALARATSRPARLAGLQTGAGFLRAGDPFRAVRLRAGPEGLSLIEVFG